MGTELDSNMKFNIQDENGEYQELKVSAINFAPLAKNLGELANMSIDMAYDLIIESVKFDKEIIKIFSKELKRQIKIQYINKLKRKYFAVKTKRLKKKYKSKILEQIKINDNKRK